jgi:phage shock protein PspC (stress-responsive transcriptional regulator)
MLLFAALEGDLAMTCKHCQREVPDQSNFCNSCGGMQQTSVSRGYKRLMRSATDRKIAGVCGGIAEYFEIDSTVVRLVWLVLLFIPVPIVPSIVAYIVAWLVMPQAPVPVAVATAPPVAPHTTQVA